MKATIAEVAFLLLSMHGQTMDSVTCLAPMEQLCGTESTILLNLKIHMTMLIGKIYHTLLLLLFSMNSYH